MSERQQRNMVERLDGRMVNAGRKRGMLMVCATGCCCGQTERGFAPVPCDLYHDEWERRKLRNKVHLNQGGCLGPCPLANVAMLLLDGRPYWFHSLNDEALIVALYDYIETLLAVGRHVAPPPLLTPHLFNGFAWDADDRPTTNDQRRPTADIGDIQSGEAIVVLTQADTDLLVLEQAQALLPPEFAPLCAAHVGRDEADAAQAALLDDVLPGAAVVVARLHSGRSFGVGLERLQHWAGTTGGFLLCIPAVDALDPELMARSTVGVPLAHMVSAYFQCGGAANVANALQCLSDHLLLSGWGYDPPRELPAHGVYTPTTNDQRRTTNDRPTTNERQGDKETGEERRETDASHRVTLSSCHLVTVPTVGILFYRAHLLSGNTAFVDAIVDELAAQGLRARAIYTQSLKAGPSGELPDALKLLAAEGPVDAIISTLSFAIGDGEPHPFALLDAPVIQAIAASVDRELWRRSGRGLGPLDTAMNVAIPEFDGRIIGVPVSLQGAARRRRRGALRAGPRARAPGGRAGAPPRRAALQTQRRKARRRRLHQQQRQGPARRECGRAGRARLAAAPARCDARCWLCRRQAARQQRPAAARSDRPLLLRPDLADRGAAGTCAARAGGSICRLVRGSA